MNAYPTQADPDESSSSHEPFVVMDDAVLALVAGGINWRFHAYQFMLNAASWNPAMLPVVF